MKMTDPSSSSSSSSSSTLTNGQAKQTVGVFCLLTALNGFQFQNLAGKVNIAKSTFSASEADINWLYSLIFIIVCAFLVPVMCLNETHPYPTAFVGCLSCSATSWLRLLAVQRRSYALALAACVPNGIQATVIVTGFYTVTVLFPPAERSRVTQLCIQANYVGWGLGTIVGPYCVHDHGSLARVLAWQAALSTLAVFAFAAFYRLPSELPSSSSSSDADVAVRTPSMGRESAEEGLQDNTAVLSPLAATHGGGDDHEDHENGGIDAASPHSSSSSSNSNSSGGGGRNAASYMRVSTTSTRKPPQSSSSSSSSSSPPSPSSWGVLGGSLPFLRSFLDAMLALMGDRAFVRQALCLSLYTGIGYAVPGIQNEIFEDGLDLSGKLSGWASFLFIFSGVAAGLGLGSLIDSSTSDGSGGGGGGGSAGGGVSALATTDAMAWDTVAAPLPSSEAGDATDRDDEGEAGRGGLAMRESATTAAAAEGGVGAEEEEEGGGGGGGGGGEAATAAAAAAAEAARSSEVSREAAARRWVTLLSYLCTASLVAMLLVQVLGPRLKTTSNDDGGGGSGGGGGGGGVGDSFATAVTAGSLMLLMIPAGASSPGVLGAGLTAVTGETSRAPLSVSETYSSSIVEGGAQLATALVVQCSSSDTGYLACTVAAAAAAAITAAAAHMNAKERSAGRVGRW